MLKSYWPEANAGVPEAPYLDRIYTDPVTLAFSIEKKGLHLCNQLIYMAHPERLELPT